MQEIYINLDDSGKLTAKEKVSVYGGLVFFSKNEKDEFITKYRSIVKEISCKYCEEDNEECSNNCPEIKNTNIKPGDKRRLMNCIKKHFIVGLVIKNEKVYRPIMENKASRGRFIDYSIRRMIKGIIGKCISEKLIDPYSPIRLVINIDQQTTKNNGYYNLESGLYEELKYGIYNFDYGKMFPPIIFGDLEMQLNYQDSNKSYVVQAADLLAGTIRKVALECIIKDLPVYSAIEKIVHYVIILP